ncbi:hypothetical protein EK21DRAFT_94400 [Setomelanomma holmii]|uniref:Uncharacterized protein n=1 Tax=Setomelanomma holmii TaxID=210430 RepID=A0A9P4GYZ0_9PLEO|nr:hypothetical protein EK21DRAFT_94400 [Setomelanomma holmii]
MGRFQAIVNTTEEEDFDALYEEMKEQYAHVPGNLAYIENNLMPTKVEWAEYTCKYIPSFRQRTTSRLDAFHGRLKKSLVNCTGHLYDIVKDLHQLARRDRHTHKALVDSAEYDLATDPAVQPGTCSGAFNCKYDLPCKNRIRKGRAPLGDPDADFTPTAKDPTRLEYARASQSVIPLSSAATKAGKKSQRAPQDEPSEWLKALQRDQAKRMDKLERQLAMLQQGVRMAAYVIEVSSSEESDSGEGPPSRPPPRASKKRS